MALEGLHWKLVQTGMEECFKTQPRLVLISGPVVGHAQCVSRKPG